MPDLLRHIINIWVAIFARACILLAFSELAFFNEGPVRDLIAARGLAGKAAYLAEFAVYYCLAGALFLALEPLMTSRARIILGGAFVGWSIEAAMVPVAYENVPFSYFWTAITWHAIFDVAIGWFILRRVFLCESLMQRIAVAIALGIAIAVWSTWTWAVLDLTNTGFATAVGAVIALLFVGYGLATREPANPKMGKVGIGLAVGINLLFAGFWAATVPLLAAGLFVLAIFNGFCLRWAPEGAKRRMPASHGLIGLWPLILSVPSALAAFAIISASGQSAAIGELLVPLVAFGGLLFYGKAVFSALRQKWTAVGF